jgi:hypothetical protein
MKGRTYPSWERLDYRQEAYEYVFGEGWRVVVLRRGARSGWWTTLQIRNHYVIDSELLGSEDLENACAEALLRAERYIRSLLRDGQKLLARVGSGAQRYTRREGVSARRRQKMTKRWVLTHRTGGPRTLVSPAQGRYTYATREEAQKKLDAIKEGVETTLGLRELEVREVECYPIHFDPKTRWFDD